MNTGENQNVAELERAGQALADLFQYALEVEGFGESHDDLIEIDAHFRDWVYARARLGAPA